MQRVTRSTAVAVAPAIPGAPSAPGFFGPGTPGANNATVPGYEWFNAVQEELIGLISRGGLAPSASDLTQIRKALDRLYAGGGRNTSGATVVLTADDAGLVQVTASATTTITLPAAAAIARPLRLMIARFDATANAVTVQAAGSDYIAGYGSSFSLGLGATVHLVSDGVSGWWPMGGTLALGSFGTNGYLVLPGGLIEQWGSISTSAGGSVAVTFPTAFPNACYNVTATVGSNAPYFPIVTGGSLTTTGFSLDGYNLAGSRASFGTMWRAIGR